MEGDRLGRVVEARLLLGAERAGQNAGLPGPSLP